jgi:hypothetical protein
MLNDLRTKHEVTQIRFVVVPRGAPCTDKPLAEVTVSIDHSLGDALIVLPAGPYNVCAIPLNSAGRPSADCPTTSTRAFVSDGGTSEVTMISKCRVPRTGAVVAVTVLNSPPVINNLVIRPSKFITACEVARLTVEASDPDGDPLSFLWEVVGARPPQTGTDQTFDFRGSPGTSQIKVTVTDSLGANTSLTLPMLVTPCTDGG